MTYSPDIPQISPGPDLSASPIQQNFEAYAAAFSTLTLGVNYNHMPLNDFNAGKHAAVIFQNQSSDRSVTEDLSAIYAKTISSQIQIFSRIQKFLPIPQDTTRASNDPVQLTYNQVNIAGPIYQSFLPGGYILYFGSTNNIATTITLTPTPSSILCAQASPQGTSTTGGAATVPYDVGVVVTQPDKIKINSVRAPGGSTFLWMAIAKQ